MNWKPKEDPKTRVPAFVKEYYDFEGYDAGRWQWRPADLCCSRCGDFLGYELYQGKLYRTSDKYLNDNPVTDDEINGIISAHYLDKHRGFN